MPPDPSQGSQPAPSPSEPFRLGEWQVEPEDGSLRCASASLRLEPQLMSLLVYLSARPGVVVSRQEILDNVWKGTLVTEDALTGSIYQLRRALGDEARAPRFIETVHKRGYRLLVTPERGQTAPDGTAQLHPRRWKWIWLPSGLLAVVVAGFILRGRGPAAHALDPRAVDAYRKARTLLDERTPESLKQAKVYFGDALRLEPRFARASAGLADVHTFMCAVGLGTSEELYPPARAAALEALVLDPGLAEAHASLGAVRAGFEWDLSGGERELHRALELAPELTQARRWHALVLAALGRRAESIDEARRAVAREPAYLPGYMDLASVLLLAHEYDEAVNVSSQALRLSPNLSAAHLHMAWAHALQGQDEAAYAAYRRTLEAEKVDGQVLELLDARFAKNGLRDVFRTVARHMEKDVVQTPVTQDNLANLYAFAGEHDQALKLLERAVRARHMAMIWVPVSPILDPLHSDPRFTALVARIGPASSAPSGFPQQ